jgi:hypothetical protein
VKNSVNKYKRQQKLPFLNLTFLKSHVNKFCPAKKKQLVRENLAWILRNALKRNVSKIIEKYFESG